MKTIYRIETVDGAGLYRGLNSYIFGQKARLKNVDYYAFCTVKHHPDLHNQMLEPELYKFAYAHYNFRDYFFGFGDIKQLKYWLDHVSDSKSLHNFLKSKLFVVVEYQVADGDFEVFNYQAVFKMKNAITMKSTDVGEFYNKFAGKWYEKMVKWSY